MPSSPGFIFKKDKEISSLHYTNPPDEWEEPKNGWCYDNKILERREKVTTNEYNYKYLRHKYINCNLYEKL